MLLLMRSLQWAVSGDTLLLEEGTYRETINLNGKAINIVGNAHKGAAEEGRVILTSSVNTPVLNITGITTDSTILIEDVAILLNVNTFC